MSTTGPDEFHKPALPFAGRKKEVAQLRRLHAQRKHILILGPEGVGKTALVRHAARLLPLLVCPQSARLSYICSALESQLGLEAGARRLVHRKNRTLEAVSEAGRTVVFDGLEWTTPRLSYFLECVSERVPVWVVARSENPRKIGHVWLLLSRFARVELRPLQLADSRALVEALTSAGRIPVVALDAVERLHRLSAGLPGVLCQLLDGLARGGYDPHRRSDLKLLDLDRRIQRLFPGGT